MRGPGSWRGIALLIGGVALGVGIAVGVPALAGGDDEPPTLSSEEVDLDTLMDPERRAEVDAVRQRAETGAAAVEQFLQAVQQDDGAASFALLSDPVRAEYGSLASWEADPDAVPDVVGFEVEEAPADAGGPRTVTTLTRYRSSLDSVAGLVPARARTSWAVVRDEDGWAVDLDATTEVPLLPPEADAVQAARAWVERAQGCQPEPRALAGQSRPAASLCRAQGAVATADTATPLTPLEVGELQNSLGGDVGEWARQVQVTSPVALVAILAPLGDAWTVVAVLEPPGAGS